MAQAATGRGNGASDASMRDRVCLVTGATSGIGRETALGLARAGASVVIVARSPERAERTRAELVRESDNDRVSVLLADLASLSEVRKLAEAFAARHAALHVLVNNAGVIHLRRVLTPDGFEATFAVNHLAHYLLTRLLEPCLRAGAPARVVNVASDAHQLARLDFDDLQSERAYQGLPLVGAMRVYGRSKLANLLFNRELARRLTGGVTANAVHPGAVATGLGQNNGALGRIVTGALRPFFLTPAQGARTTLHVATAPELATTTGRYFARCREATPAPAARDDAAARRLWIESARLVGLEARTP